MIRIEIEINAPGENTAPSNAYEITIKEKSEDGTPIGGSKYNIPQHPFKCNNPHDALLMAIELFTESAKPKK